MTALSDTAEISDLIRITPAGIGAAFGANAEAGDELVYVSLPTGVAPGGSSASVRRVGDEAPLIVSVQDGGFEPVAVLASPTDSVEIVVRSESGQAVYSARKSVRPRRPPTVVRTWPPRKKADTPVNSSMVVVLSEPVDEATVSSSSIELFRGRTRVPGTVRVMPGDGTSIAFKPNAPLSPSTEYRLVVDGSVADLEGNAIGSDIVLGFATGTGTLGPAVSAVVAPDSLYLLEGSTYQLSARFFDEAGNLLADAPIAWSTLTPNAVSVSSTGLVTALPTNGQDWGSGLVIASSGGVERNVHISVIPRPASLELLPASATVGVGDTLAIEAVARLSNGQRTRGPLTITNSNPSAASIELQQPDRFGIDPYRTLRARNPGTVVLTARIAGLSATSEITVTPPRTVGQVRVAPRSALMMVNETLRLTAYLRDANGEDLQSSPGVSWQSSNTSVMTVSSGGTVTALANGSATITATSQGVSGSTDISVTPDAVMTFESIAASWFRTCAITTSRDTYCWGYRPLGDGSTSDGSTSSGSVNRPVLVAGGLEFATVSAGGSWRGCGTTSLNFLYCWGNSALGSYSPTPVRLSSTQRFSSVSASGGSDFESHVCALDTNGGAFCWGDNGVGQLGDGTTEHRYEFTTVSGGHAFTSITTMNVQSCGVTASGQGFCWGHNFAGRLGIGSESPTIVATPTPVAGGHTFTQISMGRSHACGIATSGAAYCWGYNREGALGDGTEINRSSPVAVSGGRTYVAISAGNGHTCAITSGGEAYCWGSAFAGRLGIDPLAADMCAQGGRCKREPVAVQGGLSFVRITTGEQHSCGLTATGRMYCWGANFNGTLGDGTNTDRHMPTPVARPNPLSMRHTGKR